MIINQKFEISKELRFSGNLSAIILTAVFLVCMPESDAIPAFPGAEGFGSNTPGGRGGRIIHVTNLNPLGAGSFRSALEAAGPRIIVFDTSGVIDWHDEIVRVNNGNVTIAGQTSPGGITIINGSLWLTGKGSYNNDANSDDTSLFVSDVIMRHIRVRKAPYDNDPVTMYGVKNTIIDHVTVSWGCDESMSITHGQNVTMQWCYIEESCYGCQPEAKHNYGTLVSYNKEGTNFSLHHNFWAHHTKRCPVVNQGNVDARNNVMYDAGQRTSTFNGTNFKIYGNLINNYYKIGPNQESYRADFSRRGGLSTYSPTDVGPQAEVYLSGNVLEDFETVSEIFMTRYQGTSGGICVVDDSSEMEKRCIDSGTCRVGGPMVNIDSAPISTYSADSAYTLVLEKGGAFPRDAVTLRTVDEMKNGTGNWVNCAQGAPGDNLSLKLYVKPVDTDNDGMPDAWEDSLGLAKSDSSDCGEDRDGDGYTNIEEYINWLADELIGGRPPFIPANIKSTGTKKNIYVSNLRISPNPLSGNGNVKMYLAASESSEISGSIDVFDLKGRRVAGRKAQSRIIWNAKDDTGRHLATGLYFVKWRLGNKIIAQKKLAVVR
ncbi:MAG: T9SS type A sorting domain-containing protein [bacterium]